MVALALVQILRSLTDPANTSAPGYLPLAYAATAVLLAAFVVGAFVRRADVSLGRWFPWLVGVVSAAVSLFPWWALFSGRADLGAIVYRGLRVPQGIVQFWDLALPLKSIDCAIVGVDVYAANNGCLEDPTIYGPGVLWLRYVPFDLFSSGNVQVLGVLMILISSLALLWLARNSEGLGQIVLLLAAVGGPWLLLLERGNLDAVVIWVAVATVMLVRRWNTMWAWSIAAVLMWLMGTWKYYPFALGVMLLPALRLRRGWLVIVGYAVATVAFMIVTWQTFLFSSQSNSNMTDFGDFVVLGRVPVVARMLGTVVGADGLQIGDLLMFALAARRRRLGRGRRLLHQAQPRPPGDARGGRWGTVPRRRAGRRLRLGLQGHLPAARGPAHRGTREEPRYARGLLGRPRADPDRRDRGRRLEHRPRHARRRGGGQLRGRARDDPAAASLLAHPREGGRVSQTERRSPLAVGGSTPVAAVVVGLAAAGISLLRLWLGNHDALTQVIWAEDGVFPLCVQKADFLTCLTDPFAGYLLLLPRLVAGLVAWLPVEQWALATNLIAAALAGLVAAFAFAIVRRFGLGWVSSIIIGLLPVIVPVVGLEAINAIGSSYMLLLYISTLALAFPIRHERPHWPSAVAIAVLLLVTTLTIPTAGVFLALVLVQAIRRAVPWRVAASWLVVIGIGLLAQWLTASNAEKPRDINPSRESFDAWVSSVPDTILTFWPGLRLAPYDFFGVFPVTPLTITGALVTLAIVAGGIVLIVRGGDERVGIGLLLLTGIVVGAVPAIIGGSNNRYFVVPLLLWGAAAMVALDSVIRRSRWWMVTIAGVLVLVVWWPAIPASWFRTMPAPPWSDEVLRVQNSCATDPAKQERIIFSPYWPPDWGDALSEPTHPNLPCLVVWSWSDDPEG